LVLAAVGEATEQTEGSLQAIRESLNLVQAQMGSLDARMGLLDMAYSQVATQLDLHSRAVSDHTHVMDGIERRQESMAQHLAATAESLARICGSK
jgi:methyl-accepting chemotaxis protein